MRIQNNLMAMNTHRMYTTNNNKVSRSAEKLSSGYRINRAGDDAAGLAISEKMRAQVRGLNMASKNSQDAISLIQTAEGALQEVHSMLQRMNELANQAATGTNQTFDREQINAEFNQLKDEIDDISDQTKFNNMSLLDGSLSSGASKVSVNERTSTLYKNASFAGAGTSYTVTDHTGLANATGTCKITDIGSGKINVEYTDYKTKNVTNTAIDLNTAISGEIGAGKAFKVDLSASGLGVYDMTAANGGTPDAANLAAALAANANKVSTVGDPTAFTTTPIGFTFDEIAQDDANHNGKLEFLGANDNDRNALGQRLVDLNAAEGTYTLSLVQNGTSKIDLVASNGTDTYTIGTTINIPQVAAGGLVAFSFYMYPSGGALDCWVWGSGQQTTAGNLAAILTNTLNGSITLTPPASVASTDAKGALLIQVGANEGEQLGVSIEKMNVDGLGLTASSIADQEAAGKAITATQNAINLVSEQRATLGATQNRLEHKITNLDNTSENLASAESRIRDVDIAKEMTNYTKNNILSQAATAMLAQANASTQGVLSLLQ